VTLLFSYDNQNATASAVDLKPGETITRDIVFTEINVSLLQKLGKFIEKIF